MISTFISGASTLTSYFKAFGVMTSCGCGGLDGRFSFCPRIDQGQEGNGLFFDEYYHVVDLKNVVDSVEVI